MPDLTGQAVDTETLIADAMQVPTDDELRSVAELAASQVQLEDHIEDAEQLVRQLKADLDHVSKELLPAALKEAGSNGFTMSNGFEVKVSKIVTANIAAKWAAERREAAFSWLTENGFGDIIKHKVTATFGREEGEKALATVKELARLGVVAKDKLNVDHGTLGAFVREQTEQGNAVPDDLLGVYRGEVAKIERPK